MSNLRRCCCFCCCAGSGIIFTTVTVHHLDHSKNHRTSKPVDGVSLGITRDLLQCLNNTLNTIIKWMYRFHEYDSILKTTKAHKEN